MRTQQSFSAQKVGTLFLVPTPIGNLQDMTFRAVETLKTVDLILAEDTRNTQKLLNHFEVTTKQLSFHTHNTQERIPQIIERLQNGLNLAQVSDAGMPSISDPGYELVKACIDADISVVPLPGANAALTGLVASGLAPQPFYFYGFLPKQNKAIEETLVPMAQRTESQIFYEAPHRLVKTLTQFSKYYSANRQVVLARELTKKFEEFIRGDLSEVLQWAKITELKGEFVIIMAGNEAPVTNNDETFSGSIEDQVQALIETGLKPNSAIKEIAKRNGLSRQTVYDTFHEIN